MKSLHGRASTARFLVAMLVLLLACLLAGCGGGSLPVVLRESEALRHLPRGTRVVPPDSPAFVITITEGNWLVSAAYLSRINELLGRLPQE